MWNIIKGRLSSQLTWKEVVKFGMENPIQTNTKEMTEKQKDYIERLLSNQRIDAKYRRYVERTLQDLRDGTFCWDTETEWNGERGIPSPRYPAPLAAIQSFCAVVAVFVRNSTYFSIAPFTRTKRVQNRLVFTFRTQITITIIQPWFTSTIHKKT